MFNFTNPSMAGLPMLPDDNMPFGAKWTAPLLPGLPPKPLYSNALNAAGHPFTGSIYNFSHPFYPFFGHPNGMGGTYQSAAKGHMICIIKQVRAFRLDKTYKKLKEMDVKRNAGLADFLRACAPYAYVEFGPNGVGNDHMTRKLGSCHRCLLYFFICFLFLAKHRKEWINTRIVLSLVYWGIKTTVNTFLVLLSFYSQTSIQHQV